MESHWYTTFQIPNNESQFEILVFDRYGNLKFEIDEWPRHKAFSRSRALWLVFWPYAIFSFTFEILLVNTWESDRDGALNRKVVENYLLHSKSANIRLRKVFLPVLSKIYNVKTLWLLFLYFHSWSEESTVFSAKFQW